MFETLIESDYLIKNNFFLTSCDCLGKFDCVELRTITNTYPDVIFFGFQTSYLQKKNR